MPMSCSCASRGISTPACLQAHWVSPEQSKPAREVPPQTYGVPIADFAISTARLPDPLALSLLPEKAVEEALVNEPSSLLAELLAELLAGLLAELLAEVLSTPLATELGRAGRLCWEGFASSAFS